VDAPLASGARVQLAGSAAAHVARVLRLKAGDALTLFNGAGGEYAGRIALARGAALEVEVGVAAPLERESPLAITLVQGVSRGERMDWVVQKATELGVARLVPVLTERSVVRLDERQARKRREHWRAIAIAACEQCGRNRLPQVDAALPLRQFLREDRIEATRLMLSPEATLPLSDIPRPPDEVRVLIGPEGGLNEEERGHAAAAGYAGVRLGPRVLRTETAAVAALALLQRQFGDL